MPFELWIILLEVFVVICEAQVLDVDRPLSGASAQWTSRRVGADVGALVKPLLDAVPMARLSWDRYHRVIVKTASAVLAPILQAHATAADVLYNEAKGTILQLEEEGVDQADIISRRDQLAPLGRVFQHEQRRRESVKGLLGLAAEVGPRRRSAGASGEASTASGLFGACQDGCPHQEDEARSVYLFPGSTAHCYSVFKSSEIQYTIPNRPPNKPDLVIVGFYFFRNPISNSVCFCFL
jgi:hypothetical protein